MGEIDLPNLKQKLWQTMRGDLIALVPWFADNELLLCPTCCRALGYDDFSVEHIIPQQAVADDPIEARVKIPKNQRSGTTLLCKKSLVFEKRSIPGHGCNSWKGKHYDRFIREALRPGILQKQFHSRHHVALFCAVYLGLFRSYGYQVSLTSTGRLMRGQFFQPNSLLDLLPVQSKMVLFGEAQEQYNDEARAYWQEPFSINIEDLKAFVVTRNFSMCLPLSRDPRVPIAKSLVYAPPRYRFRPDLHTAFD